MKTSIYLHIGTHKTGTSAIQQTLIENSTELKRQGVKYINLYHFSEVQKVMHLEELNTNLTAQLKSFFEAQIDSSIQKYIVCCEYLSGNPKTLYNNVSLVAKTLHEALECFNKKHVFVVCRQQSQFIQSIYTQYIHQGEELPIETFTQNTLLDNIKWTNFIDKYKAVFGSENLKAFPYDKEALIEVNLVNVFGQFCEVKLLEHLDLGKTNLGYSKAAIKVAKQCNPYLDATEKKKLRTLLQKHFTKNSFAAYQILDIEKEDYINSYFEEDNSKLFKSYFNELALSNFSKLERKVEADYFSTDEAYSKLTTLLIKELSNLPKQASNPKSSKTIRVLKKIKRVLKGKNKAYKIYEKNTELRQIFSKYKKAVILGSAQSVNKLDLTKFSEDMVITVGNFYEHPQIEEIKPKIHVFAASHPPITEQVLKNWWTRCDETLPKSTILLIEKRDKDIADQVFKNRNVYYYSYGGQLPIDFTKPVMSPWSVTIVALQLAIYCKISEIGILGVNHDWQCIKPYTHFYDHNKPSLEYYLNEADIEISYEKQKQPFPKERLYREYELYQQYESLKSEAKKIGSEIYNYDPFSDFDVFVFDKKTELIIEEKNNTYV